MATTLRVATLNIWNRSGPWPDRLRLIRRELQRLGPAVIGLQEVLREEAAEPEGPVPAPETCQATQIADGLGYQVAYAAASVHDAWPPAAGRRQLGNAVLSRMPIRDQRAVALPVADGTEPRSLLLARIETPFGELPVFVTHLTWELHHGAARLAQVRRIAALVDELAPVGPGPPPVVMGDFNADPEADEIRFLRGLAVVDGGSVHFADAWTWGGDGSPGATFDRGNDHARGAHMPSRRIDYIFVRGPDSRLRGEPLHTELAFATPEVLGGRRTWPSDHFGLVSDVALAPRDP
jgi:endonuclease/exonuclease/phosphatase family metal-dependent hydrolase